MISSAILLSLTFATPPRVVVRVDGNRQVPTASLLAALDRAGGPMSVVSDEGLARDGLWLLAACYDRGLVEARVVPERSRSRDGTITAFFHVEEGAVYTVGQVSVVGDARGLAPSFPASGAVFGRGVVMAALEQLRQRYRDVGSEPEVTPMAEVDRERHVVDLRVEVKLPR